MTEDNTDTIIDVGDGATNKFYFDRNKEFGLSLNLKNNPRFVEQLRAEYSRNNKFNSVYDLVCGHSIFDFWINRGLYEEFETLRDYSPGDGACLFYTEYLIARKRKEQISLRELHVLEDLLEFAQTVPEGTELDTYIKNIITYLNALQNSEQLESVPTFTEMFGTSAWADSTLVKYFPHSTDKFSKRQR